MLKQTVEGYHLSPIQRRIWMVGGSDSESSSRVYATVTVRGPLNRDALKKSFQMAARRHEILRTRFCTLPGMTEPVQVIDEDDPNIEIQELESGPLQATEQQHPAATLRGSELELMLATHDTQSHLLIMNAPAINLDIRSLELLVREVTGTYRSLEAGQTAPEAAVLQYVDVSQWLSEILDARETAAGRKYWRALRSQIVGSLAPKKPDAPACTTELKTLRITMSADVMQRIVADESEKKWTTPEFLLASWTAVLTRLGYNATSIAMAFDSRFDDRLATALGPLTKYLPVVPGIQMDETFCTGLERIRGTLIKAAMWQGCFVWELLASENDEHPEQNYLACAFDYFTSSGAMSGAGADFTITELSGRMDHFGLRLSCHDCNGELKLDLSWQADLYEPHEISTVANCLVSYMADAVEHPDRAIRELNIVDQSMQARLTAQGCGTAAELSVVPFLDEQVSFHAGSNPNSVAAICGDCSLTYGELEERANQLGNYLQQLGAGPETCIALCMERSLEMVVALLGILKAGSAYLPLEPNLPAERLDYMLGDSHAHLLLTHERVRGRLPKTEVPIESVDSNWEKISGFSTGNPPQESAEENLAYVIYTSGSTGRPKGVMLTRRGLTNYVAWARTAYECTGAGRAPLCSSLGFDLTVTSLWPVLASGGAVVLATEREGMEWLARAESAPYELVKITPAHMRMLEDLVPMNRATISRLFVIGGEALRWEELQWWRRFAAGARFVNEYGPTETVVGSCVYEIGENWHDDGGIPIGRPIANTEIYVLDEQQQLLPEGCKGELYIGGAGLARGYLGQPELTAERFVPHPFSSMPGARLYHTGDHARWAADGSLEFFGRKDGQVKIRGYRVELAEIEAALLRQPEVKQAAVVVHEDGQEKRLHAYVVTNPLSRLDQDHLFKALKTELPDYMIPAHIVELDELPLSANGKIDRKALPLPSQSGKGQEEARFLNREEEILCGFFAELLNREVYPGNENFFALGGHSLLATRLISRIKHVFDIELPLRALFDAPTVSELAERVRQARGAVSMAAPPLKRVPRGDHVPLSYAQRRLWILDRMQPGSGAYNIHFGLRLAGKLDKNALQQTLDALLARHEVLRTSFPEIDGEPVQHVTAELKLPLDETDLRPLDETARETQTRKLAYEEANMPFDLTRGPLLRVKLAQLEEQMHVFFVTLHHIVSDGWSIAIIVEEFTRLYRGYIAQEAFALPELKVQYADYAIWQRGWLRDEMLEVHLKYWRARLAGAEPLKLPTDSPRSSRTGKRGGRETFELGAELTRELRGLAQREGVTLFMALLAAFQWMLARYTGQEDIIVGTDIANRNRMEIEGLIGFFVNQLVLRGDLSGNPSFREMLRRVRQTVLEAYDHQDLPFEKLVEELAPERAANGTPLFTVKMVLQNVRQSELALPELSITPLELQEMEAKFDLLVNLIETSNGLTALAHYNADLFSAGTIKTILRFYHATLSVITENSEVLDLSRQELLAVVARKARTQLQQAGGDSVHRISRQRQGYTMMKA